MLWGARGNSTRHLEPREQSRELYTEPKGGAQAAPYAPTRPPETMRRPKGWVWESSHTFLMYYGVSTRDSPYVLLVYRPQYVRTCVRPAGGGLRRRRERQPVLRTSRPATLTPTKWGVWEGERTRTMRGYLAIQQCTSSNGEKGSENENASHQYMYHVPIQGALHRLQEICRMQALPRSI